MEPISGVVTVKQDPDMVEHWVVPLRLAPSRSNVTSLDVTDGHRSPGKSSRSMRPKTSSSGDPKHKWKRKSKNDDWTEVSDHEERRRIQNRIAQRKFREKAREQKERAERESRNHEYAGGSYTIPKPGGHPPSEDDTSGLPWGGFNLRYTFTSGLQALDPTHKATDAARYAYTGDDTNQGQRDDHDGKDYHFESPFAYDYDTFDSSTGRPIDSCRRESDSAYGSASSQGLHTDAAPELLQAQKPCSALPVEDAVEVQLARASLEEQWWRPAVVRQWDPPKSTPDSPKLDPSCRSERLESTTPTAEVMRGEEKDRECDESGGSDSTSTLESPSSSVEEGEESAPLHTATREKAIADMIDRVMEEFWSVFGNDWDMLPSVDSPGEANESNREGHIVATVEHGHSAYQPRRNALKRERDNDGDVPDDDEDDGRQHFSKAGGTGQPNKEPVRFSCLFRKHDPLSFSIHTHKICALSPWPSISRLKEHLYRAHKIPPHCKRCWKVFEKETELDEHIMVPAADICETRPGTSPAGITPDQVNQLRSRKKSSRNQTDEDRWRDMYRLLFPNDVVPSPYFEPPVDQCGLSPDSQDLLEYESFLRLEMPRLVRSSLEQQARIEIQPLEQALIESLPRIIQDCQESAFRAYRQQKRASSVNSSQTAIQDSVGSQSTERSQTVVTENQDATSVPMSEILDSAYQPPPAREPGLADDPDARWTRPEEVEAPSDSGYGSICSCVGSCTCCWWDLFDNSDFPG